MPDMQRNSPSGRIEWVDFAKGIGILLVIVGHTATVGRQGSILRGLLFSFHMPLFFMLSSMTFRCSADLDEFWKKTRGAARHLLVPVLVSFALLLVGAICYDRSRLTSLAYWRGQLYSLIIGSGVPETFSSVEVPLLGIPWFFYALFFSRTLFDYLHLRFGKAGLPFYCCLVSAVGVALGRDGYLPMSLDIALAIVPFCYAGWRLKSHAVWNRPARLLGASLAVWLLTLWLQFPDIDKWSYLELASRRYPLYPICFVTAIAGSLTLCAISLLAMRLGRMTAPVSYLGRNSMVLLIVHFLDGYWYRWWAVPGRQFVESAKRVAVDLAIFAVFMLAKAGFDRLARARRQARSNNQP